MGSKYPNAQFLKAIQESKSWTAVVRNLGLSVSSAPYLKRVGTKLNINTDHFALRKYQYSDQQLLEAIANSSSKRQVLFSLGVPDSPSHYDFLYERTKKLGLDIDEMIRNNGIRPTKNKLNSQKRIRISLKSIKNSLIASGQWKKECSICKINEWNGKPLALQIDHINGIKNDNRTENLRLLCLSCHSQTLTYTNKRRDNRVSASEPSSLPEYKPFALKECYTRNEFRNDAIFTEVVARALSYFQIASAFTKDTSMRIKSETVKNRIKRLGINTSHLLGKGYLKGKSKGPSSNKPPLHAVLIENSNYSRHALKRRLLEEGFLIEKCAICGQSNEWQQKRLVLRLDHINGKNKDNRLENLRMLCPNCDSQLDTFAGKNVNDLQDKPGGIRT